LPDSFTAVQLVRAALSRRVQAVISMDITERVARLEALCQRLERLRAPATRKKKKSGRPGIWKGREGFLLVIAVNSIRREHGKGIADAIVRLKARSRWWRSFGHRELQSRFQEARRYWMPILRRFEELREFEIELAALKADSEADKANDPLYRLMYGDQSRPVTKSPRDFS
jgi:hypothetical protein